MSDIRVIASEIPPAPFRRSDGRGPLHTADNDADVLRRRLQYAWNEIAHLNQALKQARGKDSEDTETLGSGFSTLRGEVETLRQTLQEKSAELESEAAERERLAARVRAEAAARDQAMARADRTIDELQALRRVVAQMRHQVDDKTLELGSRQMEYQELAIELERRTAALEELQRRIESQTQASETISRPPSTEALSRPLPLAPDSGLAARQGVWSDVPAEAEPPPLAPKPEARPAAPTLNVPAPVVPTILPAAPQQATPATARPAGTRPWAWPSAPHRAWAWALAVCVMGAGALGVGIALRHFGKPQTPASHPLADAASDAPQPVSATLTDAETKIQPQSIRPATQVATPPRGLRDRLRAGGLGPVMIRVGPATFTMGNPMSSPEGQEWPTHEVRVGRFLIGATEVTFAEYDAYARSIGGRLPEDYGWGRGRRPVVGVTWTEANNYAAWLSAQTGRTYRLPSEAEWEYAARGDSPRFYWWGNQLDSGRAVCFNCGSRWDNQTTAPVASLAPNPFGLYDTAGNAMEWVGDCWNPNYTGAPGDARTRSDGDCTSRVARGGAFNKPAISMRSSTRNRFAPNTRIDMLGFRVVREP